ncbi:NrdH-like glutaredoxin [Mycobacterium phage SlimJimmy]|nr:NrdH-like glutaredoxin [Mycobacterium phage SirSheldon]WMI33220.1 NrdH-like glutaredoxin [Mycobacterium phage SlimJimmy]WNM75253.1 NrdH-like glutaredoxin [Mycobacterium phage Auspice]
MNVTVYTTGPACIKCKLTKDALAKKGIAYTEVRLDQDSEQADLLRAQGYSVAPVVVVQHDDGSQEKWGDFRVDYINALAKRSAAAA